MSPAFASSSDSSPSCGRDLRRSRPLRSRRRRPGSIDGVRSHPGLLAALQDPRSGETGLRLEAQSETGSVENGALIAPSGSRSVIRGGIWNAMGGKRMSLTLAQLSNVLPPTPQLYEKVWRVRSLSLLTRRPFPIEAELAEMIAAIEPQPDQVIVDVACSEGLYARTLAKHGAVVAGVDHSVPFLRRVQRRAAADGVDVEPVRALAQQLPFGTGAVDAVVMGGSLNEIGDRWAAFSEMGRVLRPGGRWFTMSLSPASSFAGKFIQRAVRPAGIVFPTIDQQRAMAMSAGLRIDEERSDGVVLRLSGTRG
jgi:SAM-dependent methyltransferase